MVRKCFLSLFVLLIDWFYSTSSFVQFGVQNRFQTVARITQEAQGDNGGVQLPSKEDSETYSEFLSQAVQAHLDQEWLHQSCHADIGNEVANIYLRSTVHKETTDLNKLIMDIGSGLESFDMGDSFVGAWDVANIVSDYMLKRMGLETTSCSTKLPNGIGRFGNILFNSDTLQDLIRHLDSEFNRYKWLSAVVSSEIDWDEINSIMALNLGYRVMSETGILDYRHVTAKWVNRGIAGAPDFSFEEDAIELLHAELPTHPDDQESMEHFIEVLFGEESKRFAEQGEDSDEFLRRCTVVKWLYINDFLTKRPVIN